MSRKPKESALVRGNSAIDLLRNSGVELDPASEGRRVKELIIRTAKKIRAMREEAGLTQSALAKRAGMAQADISRIESGLGTKGPSLVTIDRLAAACDSDFDVAFNKSEINKVSTKTSGNSLVGRFESLFDDAMDALETAVVSGVPMKRNREAAMADKQVMAKALGRRERVLVARRGRGPSQNKRKPAAESEGRRNAETVIFGANQGFSGTARRRRTVLVKVDGGREVRVTLLRRSGESVIEVEDQKPGETTESLKWKPS